jgi:transglutaminase-like putative cysteine protease
MTLRSIVVATALLCSGTVAFAQDAPIPAPPESDNPVTQQVQFGMVFEAHGGPVRDVTGTVTVPADWPGQQRVKVVKEEIPRGATVTYKDIRDVGRQMVVHVITVPAGRELRAVVTFEVERLSPPPLPQDTEKFTVPKRDRRTLGYFQPSPRIESDAPQVRKAAEAAVAGRPNAWERVKAIHEWVHQNIKFAGGLENVQTTVTTLSTRSGVCAELNSLAVAMLRAQGIPARLVRIPGHCYYEVCLLVGEDDAQWLSGDASQAATITPTRAASGLILQKGDNVTIVDPATKKRAKGRFLAETATGVPGARAATLTFKPISPAIDAHPVTPR